MMRFKITLNAGIFGRAVLPINYQYELSAAIYRIIKRGDNNFADWLHNEGYGDSHKRFKHFTFSNLIVQHYKIDGDRIKLNDNTISFYISFYANNITEPFITGLFEDQQLNISDQKSGVDFNITQVEKIKDPAFGKEILFNTISPVVVSIKKENYRYATYLSPEDVNYQEQLMKNLIEKYWSVNSNSMNSIMNSGESFEFKLLNKPRQKLITIKSGTPQETRIKGFQYKCQLKAPVELIKTAYYAGIGEKNSLGFGFGEEVG